MTRNACCPLTVSTTPSFCPGTRTAGHQKKKTCGKEIPAHCRLSLRFQTADPTKGNIVKREASSGGRRDEECQKVCRHSYPQRQSRITNANEEMPRSQKPKDVLDWVTRAIAVLWTESGTGWEIGIINPTEDVAPCPRGVISRIYRQADRCRLFVVLQTSFANARMSAKCQ
jgi:hypothetical protein